MSAGGVFKLIANDGKADRMIMATDLLNQRIKDIMCMRAKKGFKEITPTLVDIERTHILFVNAHFKPFAAHGFEYNKVRVNAGVPQFGNDVTFSIPLFGDFIYDMVVNANLAATQATLGTVPALPEWVGADDQGYLDVAGAFSPLPPATTYGKISGTEDAAAGIYTSYTHQYVDSAGNIIPVGASRRNYVRYAEFPGERICKKIKFEVNNNPLDDYTEEKYMFHRKYCVQPNKLTGWKRLVGQEVPVESYSDLVAITGTSNYSTVAVDLVDINGDAASAGAVSSTITARKVFQIVNGPQTPKETQPALDMWIPLLFWFNRDPRLSIPSVAIPYGQRFITCSLNEQAKLLFVAPGDLWLKLTVERTYSNDAGTKGTKAALAVYRRDVWETKKPVLVSGSVIDTTQQISAFDLYINNIFVNPEIHDIYIRRIGFSLIRVHRYQVIKITESANSFQLSQLKWPIETMYIGIRPTVNTAADNVNQYRDWHRLTLLTDSVIDVPACSNGKLTIDDTVPFDDTGSKIKYLNSQCSIERINAPIATETIRTLSLQAHSVTMFDAFKAAFYRDYMSYNYGGHEINTPEDLGAMMMNFCFYPGTYQPSGHINVSRAREFYLQYDSGYVSTSTPADLVILAIAINFLLVADGSALLRYTT